MESFWFFVLAGIASFAGALFHGYLGGNIYMKNINESNMNSLTRSLSLISWHIFTTFLLVGGATFFLIALNSNNETLKLAVYPIIVINLMGALLFIALGLGNHPQLLRMPGAYLMAAIAILGLLGI